VGRADKELRKPEDPYAAANRRITLKMKFDLSKKIDLSKNPKELDNLDRLKEDARKEKERETMQPGPGNSKGQDTVHSLTTKEIIEGGKQLKLEKLPDEDGRKMNPEVRQKDKIFGDNPVIGPADPFAIK
jgi:hypothetical protein